MIPRDESIICSLRNASSAGADGGLPVSRPGHTSVPGCRRSCRGPTEYDTSPGTEKWKEKPTCESM